jgi:hypothetical protein
MDDLGNWFVLAFVYWLWAFLDLLSLTCGYVASLVEGWFVLRPCFKLYSRCWREFVFLRVR